MFWWLEITLPPCFMFCSAFPGTIPREVGAARKLELLLLNDNQLTGEGRSETMLLFCF